MNTITRNISFHTETTTTYRMKIENLRGSRAAINGNDLNKLKQTFNKHYANDGYKCLEILEVTTTLLK